MRVPCCLLPCKIVGLFPCNDVCRSWLNMAVVLQRVCNKPFAAERYYLTALRLAPGNPNILINLSEFLQVRDTSF